MKRESKRECFKCSAHITECLLAAFSHVARELKSAPHPLHLLLCHHVAVCVDGHGEAERERDKRVRESARARERESYGLRNRHRDRYRDRHSQTQGYGIHINTQIYTS